MTADDFTTAARAEAERRWNNPLVNHDPIAMAVDTALWARDHLAAQEPTDAEVEAAAKAQYRNPDGWDLVLAAYRNRVADEGPIPDHVIAHRLELARDALRAARAVGRDAR